MQRLSQFQQTYSTPSLEIRCISCNKVKELKEQEHPNWPSNPVQGQSTEIMLAAISASLTVAGTLSRAAATVRVHENDKRITLWRFNLGNTA